MARQSWNSSAAILERSADRTSTESNLAGMAWHTQPVERVLQLLASAPSGLTSQEVSRRLERYGANELQALARATPWHTLAAQFKNVLTAILLGATVVSGLLGHTLEAVVIAIIVMFAVLLGFVQEYRAERAM